MLLPSTVDQPCVVGFLSASSVYQRFSCCYPLPCLFQFCHTALYSTLVFFIIFVPILWLTVRYCSAVSGVEFFVFFMFLLISQKSRMLLVIHELFLSLPSNSGAVSCTTFFAANLQPILASNLRPILASNLRPILASNLRPILASNLRPILASNLRPILASNLRPILASKLFWFFSFSVSK